MHFEASKAPSGRKAPVGQAFLHLLQFLHEVLFGLSGANSKVVTISASKSCEPSNGFISI